MPSAGSRCQLGGVQRPLYRSAAAYAKFCRSCMFVGATVRAWPPLAHDGVNRIENMTGMLYVCAYATSRS